MNFFHWIDCGSDTPRSPNVQWPSRMGRQETAEAVARHVLALFSRGAAPSTEEQIPQSVRCCGESPWIRWVAVRPVGGFPLIMCWMHDWPRRPDRRLSACKYLATRTAILGCGHHTHRSEHGRLVSMGSSHLPRIQEAQKYALACLPCLCFTGHFGSRSRERLW
jgi:hypothetical protein